MVVLELLKLGVAKLKDCKIPNCEGDAKRLLCLALDIKYNEYNKDQELTKAQCKKFFRLIKLRSRHVPMDKIFGYTEFLGLRIPFNRNVLTPRQETEILTDRVIKDIKKAGKSKTLSVLDLCSGSGCIGLAIAGNTQADVTLSDISKYAIKISKKNYLLNSGNMPSGNKIEPTFVVSDLFDSIDGKFDIIISNPPYIRSEELKHLEIEVRDFDPTLALDGGVDGLDFYKRLIKSAPKYLNDSATLYLEIGIQQSDEIVKLLARDFENIVVEKDYSGIDRFIIAKKRDKNVK